MSNANSSPEEGEGNGNDIGYSVEINTKYEVGEEFKKPEYLHGPHVEVNDAHVELSLARTRAVSKKNKVSLEADLPSANAGIKADQEEAYVGIKGSVGQTEFHAGPLGAGVQGLSGGVEGRIGERGIQAEGGYNVVSGMVQTGPVKVGADIGVRGALRVGYGGVGAIIPGFGGAIIAKDGLEVDLGPFSFKIGW